MAKPEILEMLAREDDELLSDIVLLLVRRRAAGFSPALLVSVNERHEVVSDAYIGREDAEELIAFLHQGGFADGAELETDGL